MAIYDIYGNVISSGGSATGTATLKERPWKVAAHRGYTASGLPENSIPSLIEAKKMGFDLVECDIRVTSDGYFILNHDATLKGIDQTGTTQTLTVAESTLAELQALKIGTSAVYGDIYPTTWDEFLRVASLIDIELTCDLYGTMSQANYEDIAMLTLRHGMGGKVIYTTSSTSVIGYISAIDRRGKYKVNVVASGDYSQYASLMTEHNEFFLCVQANGAYLSNEYIDHARKVGMRLYAWNVGSANYEAVFNLRPDIIENISSQMVKDYSQMYLDAQNLY